MLDKQRDILDFLLGELFATSPNSILSVRQSAKQNENIYDDYSSDSSIFAIGSNVSSKVEGAIETIPFEISFSGKTNTLRDFLNRLVEFRRPIVVRSINVSRPNDSVRKNIAIEEDLESLSPDELEALKEESKREPVVTENISEFTLTLEYIEVILPDDLLAESRNN